MSCASDPEGIIWAGRQTSARPGAKRKGKAFRWRNQLAALLPRKWRRLKKHMWPAFQASKTKSSRDCPRGSERWIHPPPLSGDNYQRKQCSTAYLAICRMSDKEIGSGKTRKSIAQPPRLTVMWYRSITIPISTHLSVWFLKLSKIYQKISPSYCKIYACLFQIFI